MLPYQYQPLQYNDSIRVLILHPSSNISDPIICTIQHIRLSDKSVNYEALSYTWGDITQKQAIFFYGGTKELLVGRTCHDALRHLRQETTYRLLWIDAICINQEDLLERTHQVRMMDDVYNCASQVVVFLGEHAAGSRVLFEELAAADKLLMVGKECNRPPPSELVIQELEKLYTRPWFKRVWVIQEVCMKDPIIFMCGSAGASYAALSKLEGGYSRTKVTKVRRPGVLNWVRTPREDFSTPQLSLWHRLHESRDCLATDPRDRVFAMKSLIGSRQSELDPLIDYTVSLEKCFIEVAKFLLPTLGLRMLTAIRHTHDKDMPSWVPDWSQNLPLHSHYRYSKLPYDPSDSEHMDGSVSETKSMHDICTISGSEDRERLELLTRGYQCAHIIDTSHEFSFGSIEEAETQMKRFYYSFPNLRNIFAVGEMQDDQLLLQHLGEDIAMAISLIDGPALHCHLTRQVDGWYTVAHWPIRGEQIYNFRDSLQQCRICLLESGELAILPEGIRVNDIICILSNTDSPCALRPDGNGNWTLVSGDCYIFGDVSVLSLSHGGVVLDEYIAGNRDKIEKFTIR